MEKEKEVESHRHTDTSRQADRGKKRDGNKPTATILGTDRQIHSHKWRGHNRGQRQRRTRRPRQPAGHQTAKTTWVQTNKSDVCFLGARKRSFGKWS